MEGTPQLGETGRRAVANRTPPVTADVLECPQDAVVAPDDERRVRAAAVLECITGPGHVIGGAGELPDPGPEAPELQIGEPRIDVTGGGNGHRPGPPVLRRWPDRFLADPLLHQVGHRVTRRARAEHP